MAAQPVTGLTPEEYIEFERASETKHEYYNGDLFAMAGTSYAHGLIVGRLTIELGIQLRSRDCGVVPNDLRVRVSPSGLYTYPDLVVVCGQPQFADDQKDTLLNPTVLIEVLSPSTEAHDRGLKFAQYRKLESLKEYVLVSQQEARVEVFSRRAAGQWLMTDFIGAETECRLESVACTFPLSAIYAGLTLDNPSIV